MTVGSKALLGALLLILAADAHGDPRADADQAFKHGREAFKAQRYKEACDAFETSQALDPQLGTKFNLAQCYEKIGKLATANTMYKELLAVDENAARKALTHEALAALAPRVPKIEVVIDQVPRGLVVTLRDAMGAERTIEIREPALVDVGDYKVIATGTGMHTWASPITSVVEGQTTQIVVVFTPAEPTPVAEPHSILASPAHSHLRAVGVIAGGGVLVIASLGVGYSALSYYHRAEDICGGRNMCPVQADVDRASSLRDKAHFRGTISNVLFGFGAAMIGTGTVMYLLGRHSEPAVSVHVGESTGVTVSGSF